MIDDFVNGEQGATEGPRRPRRSLYPRPLGPSNPSVWRGQAGSSLITVLIMIGTLTPLAAFAVMQARLDLVAQERIRAGIEAFYAAESGLEAALADLRDRPQFERLRAGPDGIVGSADDDRFPFRLNPPEVSADANLRFGVRVEPVNLDTVEVIADGFAFGGAMHVVAATVRRGTPFVPGAIYSSAPSVTVAASEEFAASGFDDVGRDPAQPAIAVTNEDAAAALRRDLAAAQDRWRGSGGDPSVAVREVLDVEKLAVDLGGDPNGVISVDPAPVGALGSGTLISGGSVDVADASGLGALIVNGNLRVTGGLRFEGLVLVLGDVLFEPGSRIDIDGALLQGRGRGVLQLLGSGDVTYNSRAIDALATRVPGILPRRAEIVGWKDLS